jgi:hypothetical protein
MSERLYARLEDPPPASAERLELKGKQEPEPARVLDRARVPA